MKIKTLLALGLLGAGCTTHAEPNAVPSGCEVLQGLTPLPEGVEETSGLAVGQSEGGILWTHNDSGGEPLLYAIDRSGKIRGRVRVEAAKNRDWEDIARGSCPSGSCLFIGDIGDNAAERDDLVVYRMPEPAPDDERTAPADRFPIRYPGGARDAEALFVLPSGELFVVTKGRSEPVELYRYPLPFRAQETVELELVATLGHGPRELGQQVTGADASPEGEWVVVRTYGSLMVYRTRDLLRGEVEPARAVSLVSLSEPQGEAIAMEADGSLWLTSESGSGWERGTLSRLACSLPE